MKNKILKEAPFSYRWDQKTNISELDVSRREYVLNDFTTLILVLKEFIVVLARSKCVKP